VVLARVSAFLSLVLGLWGFAAALSVLGLVGGVVMGPLAVLFGWASLSERPPKWTRRVALSGVVTGSAALFTALVWIVLFMFGV
jgi:hypothetical protein